MRFDQVVISERGQLCMGAIAPPVLPRIGESITLYGRDGADAGQWRVVDICHHISLQPDGSPEDDWVDVIVKRGEADALVGR